ncbi:transducin/WD40 repeat-like superfamily protein [Striga asiatica]|uniref:Transducin/WD40 repeat-like superfamily protein n=1 Tax=Striga asiatica TaxID=4170 RepID=A0A5A7PW01_STRAF|nr:transducin/WD40 repeat-like superfamily protein [Striga asiatica]
MSSGIRFVKASQKFLTTPAGDRVLAADFGSLWNSSDGGSEPQKDAHPNHVEIVQLDDSTSEILPAHQAHLRARQGVPAPRFAHLLRLCQISDSDGGRRMELKSLLNNCRNSEFSGPLTSFDWNEAEPQRIGTSISSLVAARNALAKVEQTKAKQIIDVGHRKP